MIDDFLKHVFAGPVANILTFLKVHFWIGYLVGALVFLWTWLPKVFDGFDVWKARLVTPLARTFRFKWLARAATKYDVRGHVNRAINTIAPELPDGWISDIDLRFINGESRAEFFANNKPIVHIRPFDDQDRNVVTVINLFLREALFGDARHIIPDTQRTAAILYFGDRICESRSEATLKAFGKYVIEPAIKGKKKIMEYYRRYLGIDQRGLFTGPYIREIKHVAEEVRATRFHDRMSAEMNEALVHLEQFSAAYEKSQQEHIPMRDDAWKRAGIMTKYALLLVANPAKAIVEETSGYVNRALGYYREGARRIYVLGTADQRKFASKVIKRIENETPFILEQKFKLYRDYRMAAGGIAAVFCLEPQREVEWKAKVAATQGLESVKAQS